MGETGSRGKEGMMPAGKMTCFWWDTYAYFAFFSFFLFSFLFLLLFFFFFFSSLCWRVLQAVGRVGTNWLNDTRMPDSARSLTADWGGGKGLGC